MALPPEDVPVKLENHERRISVLEERLNGKNSWAQVLVMAMVTMVAAFGGVLLAKALGN